MGRARSPDTDGASRHRRAKPDPLDRRLNPRVRTDQKAVVEIGETRIVCAVRDRSDTGARIVLRDRHELPERFWLVIAADGRRLEAHLIWTDGQSAGLRFDPSA